MQAQKKTTLKKFSTRSPEGNATEVNHYLKRDCGLVRVYFHSALYRQNRSYWVSFLSFHPPIHTCQEAVSPLTLNLFNKKRQPEACILTVMVPNVSTNQSARFFSSSRILKLSSIKHAHGHVHYQASDQSYSARTII